MNEKSHQRPRQNYLEMGLKIGDRVIFEKLPEEMVHIASAHKLHWKGRDISITALRELLGLELGTARYSARILINGRTLDDLYDETYGPKH